MQERGWVVEGWGHAGERMGGEGWGHTEKGGIDKEESGMLIMHTHTHSPSSSPYLMQATQPNISDKITRSTPNH